MLFSINLCPESLVLYIMTTIGYANFEYVIARVPFVINPMPLTPCTLATCSVVIL